MTGGREGPASKRFDNRNGGIVMRTLIIVLLSLFVTTAAFAQAQPAKCGGQGQPAEATVTQDIDVIVQPAPVKVVTPKKVTVTGTVGIDGTVQTETTVTGTVGIRADKPIPVTGKVAIDGPVVLDTSRPIPFKPVEPIEVKWELHKQWWFWTAVGVVVTGAVVGGVCGGGYCGGTHHNTVSYQP